MRTIIRSALTAALAACALLAWAATAGATTVAPAGHDWEATAGPTAFLDNNGTGALVTCATSTATGTLPGGGPPPPAGPAYNFDSLADGSVIGPIHTLTFNPPCTAVGLDATVEADADTLSSSAEHTDANGDAAVAINVPGDGATITVPLVNCVITLPDDQANDPELSPVAASVFGTFTNGQDGEPATPSELSVKGQLPATDNGNCGPLVSQGVFFANGETVDGVMTTTYQVVDTTDPNRAITITSP